MIHFQRCIPEPMRNSPAHAARGSRARTRTSVAFFRFILWVCGCADIFAELSCIDKSNKPCLGTAVRVISPTLQPWCRARQPLSP